MKLRTQHQFQTILGRALRGQWFLLPKNSGHYLRRLWSHLRLAGIALILFAFSLAHTDQALGQSYHQVKISGCKQIRSDIASYLESLERFEITNKPQRTHSRLKLKCGKTGVSAQWTISRGGSKKRDTAVIGAVKLARPLKTTASARVFARSLIDELLDKIPFDAEIVSVDKDAKKNQTVTIPLGTTNTFKARQCTAIEILAFDPASKMQPFKIVTYGFISNIGASRSFGSLEDGIGTLDSDANTFYVKLSDSRKIKSPKLLKQINECYVESDSSGLKSLYEVSAIRQVAGLLNLGISNEQGQDVTSIAASAMNQVEFGKHILFSADAMLNLGSQKFKNLNPDDGDYKATIAVLKAHIIPRLSFGDHRLGLAIGGIRDSVNDQVMLPDETFTVRPKQSIRPSFGLSYSLNSEHSLVDILLQTSALEDGMQFGGTFKYHLKITRTWTLGLMLMQHTYTSGENKEGVLIHGEGIELGFSI